MKLQGFIGQSYNLASVNADCQRSVNLYPEVIESGLGKESQNLYLKSASGLRKILSVGNGPIRLIHIDPVGTILVASGFEMFRVIKNGDTYSSTKIGDLEKILYTNPMKAETIANGSQLTTVITDSSSKNYIYTNTNSTSGSFGDFAGFGFPPTQFATHVCFLDGFLIYIVPDENKFYVSEWSSLSVDPLSFASSEASPDKIVSAIVNNRELWIFNERTTEIYYNSGNADFPFERIQGGVIEKGCLAPYSPAKIDGSVFWLGQDDFGQGVIYMASGMQPKRISSHAIEQKISKLTDLEKATGFTFQEDGHSFYQINLSDTSFLYDLSTGMWHERCDLDSNGSLTRQDPNNCAFSIKYGFHILGSHKDGSVYIYDKQYFYNGDNPLARIRISPHYSNSLKNLFWHSLQIDMETGVGIDSNLFGSNPKASLSWSNDGGHTWSNELIIEIGKIGEYRKRAIWRRLGYAKDRVWKLVIADPVRVNLLNAEAEVG